MAQLKDSIVSGNLRVTDSTMTDGLQVTTIKAPTSSGGTTYGPGTNGQVLKSNGSSTYWGTDASNSPSDTVTSVSSSGSAGTATTYSRGDHTHGITVGTGDNNGQVKVAGQNISVKGLTAAAYKGVTDNSTATAVTSTDTNLITGRTLYNAGYTKNTGTVTSVKVGTTSYNPSSGVVSLPAYPTTLPASDTTSTYSASGTVPVNGTAVNSAIGYVTEIPSGALIDDYTTTGTYYCPYGTGVWNPPCGTNFYLRVIHSAGQIVQIGIPDSSDSEGIYIRTSINGAFNVLTTPWELIPNYKTVAEDYSIQNDATIKMGDASYTPIAFAQCDTAASERQKVASIVDNATWTRKVGSIVAVKFANTNTYEATASNHVTLNVNGTGDADIYYNNTNANTGVRSDIYGYKNRYNFYIWNGTYWVWLNRNVDGDTTYSIISEAEITAGTSTTSRVITAARLLFAIQNWVFHSTTALANGDDLNNITTLGVYRAATAPIAQSIIHRPAYADAASKAFRLEVLDGSGTYDRQMQKMYVFNVTTGAVEEFIRFHTSSGWGSWYQTTMSAVSDYDPT